MEHDRMCAAVAVDVTDMGPCTCQYTTPHLSKDGGSPFSEWLDKLEAIMREWDAKHGNLPYGLPLDRADDNGNICCWRDSFDDGMTPQEAFDSDQSYWCDY